MKSKEIDPDEGYNDKLSLLMLATQLKTIWKKSFFYDNNYPRNFICYQS